jgi:hypothetical protein
LVSVIIITVAFFASMPFFSIETFLPTFIYTSVTIFLLRSAFNYCRQSDDDNERYDKYYELYYRIAQLEDKLDTLTRNETRNETR